MPIHEAAAILNSALLLALVVGMISFHRDWSEIRLMVRTLWSERETREDARVQAEALRAARTAGSS